MSISTHPLIGGALCLCAHDAQERKSMFKRVLFTAALLGLLLPVIPVKAYNTVGATTYAQAHSSNPWSTMALAAVGAANIPTDYLKTVTGSAAIDYAAPILAITSVGQDPRVYGATDYIAKLKSFYTNNQIGDETTVNDDIFGLLALLSDGEGASVEAAGAKAFLLAHQNANGGWGFAVGGGSDSNITAVGVVALIASGTSASDAAVTKALDYLKTAQNTDGGFTYDPVSMYGTASDASSTAWVLWALTSAGIDQTTWAKGGHTPVEYLESTQAAGGYFQYQAGSGEDAFSATTTAYAIIALLGKTLPVHSLAGGTPAGGGSGAVVIPTYSFKIEGSTGTLCTGTVAGPTALDVVKNASSVCGFTYHIKDTSFGPYLDKIGTDEASGTTGWLYAVNNTLATVGADQFTLHSGDVVLWHFGAFDWQPTGASSGQAGEVQLSVNVTAGTPPGQVQGASIGFIVTPGSVNFGDLKAGGSISKNVTVKNIGTTGIKMAGQVTGDSAFTNNLQLDAVAWVNFSKTIGANNQADVAVSLQLPSNVSLGQKNGKLVFWATAQ